MERDCRLLSWIAKTSKKELYVYVSLVLGFGLFVVVLWDLIAYAFSERTELSTQNVTDAVLVVHLISFFLGILGFVYSTQAGKFYKRAKLELYAVALNFLVCVLRFTLEISFIGYRREEYRNLDSGK
ncbi:hypothetical protein HOLleu_08354 [Holothuria leucospilota]|uniref:Uncharacterized protein n=1 Tax=Holothuria leucospilota TaxID=206669 RepID=A0A9Q1HHT5_HOLLE|nr:hypothetical protein HOLleu_08354 [Holothuria leucospilota]